MTDRRDALETEGVAVAENAIEGQDAALDEPKAAEFGFALPCAGLLLLSPPIIDIFATDRLVFGAPGVVAYLFALWAALILLAWRLSRRLSDAEDAVSEPTAGAGTARERDARGGV